MSSSPHREHRQRKSRYRARLTSGQRPHDRGWNGSRLARLMARHGGQCALCGTQCNTVVGARDQATCDHIIPVSKGGLDVPGNWQLACATCNQRKGSDMTIRIRKQDAVALLKDIRDRLDNNEPITVVQSRWLVNELERVQAELREARRTAGDGGGHE